MTHTQEIKIELIKNEWMKIIHSSKNNKDYEFKKFEIVDEGYGVFLYVESGLKGDEGTYASIFCRDSAHIFIGKRGGMKHFNKKGKLVSTKYLYQAIYDYRH